MDGSRERKLGLFHGEEGDTTIHPKQHARTGACKAVQDTPHTAAAAAATLGGLDTRRRGWDALRSLLIGLGTHK